MGILDAPPRGKTVDRSAWAASTTYAVGDIVSYSGRRYICPAAFTSGASFVESNWVPLSLPRDGFACPMVSGNYYMSPAAAVTTRQLSQGNVYLGRIVAGRSCTLNGLAVEITVAGTAGSVVRLGLYALDWATQAITLLADAGTIDGTVVGLGTAAISVPVVEGQQLLLACVGQGAPTTQPTVRGVSGVDPYWGFTNGLTTSQASTLGVQVIGGAAGVLPSTLSGQSTIGGIPRVLVKAA